MKILSVAVCSALFLNFSLANSELIEKAKSFGLVALPKDKTSLEKFIEESAQDSKVYPTTQARVELGKMLYFDPRLSKSGIISCNTCHNLGYGGADNIPASTGHKWTPNPHHINAPTVYNSVFNSVQFWDGRAAHLAAQAAGPMTAEPEMASSPQRVEEIIKSIPEYVKFFEKAYNKGVDIDFDLITATIGIFERTLVTPSRFDDFLNGKENALTKEEKAGLDLFIEKGCVSCHNGVNLGGSMQAFEVVSKYKFANIGDFKGDKDGMVKTPVLRNIMLTAPYFHNGAIWDIEEAIKEMGSIQLGIEITDKEANSIASFFKSLNGKMPKITYPILPPSTKQTPKPELDY
ncbi:cytochrome-c peroxidase [Campylobacter sp. FMV-PI01]|uniref:Cytochrome-c peroxidase n=1 Tax=Campylobacter portucalensis TaxID=2608384 RepID=A0A6L5WKV2_9BACT|nr:cytochrome-c peroxidase [Campylobacter portucalensis]MSN96625.1 cytochrome-c peroxidase [Campylobacter portucalensis]